MRTAAAELVTILHDEGISHLFVNPGMHTAPLRAALADAGAAGIPHPQPVLCVHEHVALSAAHGHHLAGGGPQAVMLHVDSGRLDLGGAVDSAQRDRVPVTVFSGGQVDVPLDEACGSRPPEAPACDLLRSAGKWATDLSRGGDLSTLVRRAFQIARAEPGGLTHVALPLEALRQPVGRSSRRLPPPRPPAPDLTALEEMAELLATAESPVVVTGRVGRHVASVPLVAQLAETLGAPVIDFRNQVNLPPGHPLNAAMEGRDLLASADAILLLDVDLACVPRLGPLPPHAWLLQIDSDCLKASLPGWACPIEIAITADTGMALPPLLTLLDDRLSGRRRQVQDRRARAEAAVRAARESWRARSGSSDPTHVVDAALAELARCLCDGTSVIEEAAASNGGALRQMERPPGHFFRSMSTDPGWSIGAALGARLARPNHPVVAICDDSAFTYGLPTAAFWSAHRCQAPFLTVVMDRGRRGGRPPAAQPNGITPRVDPDVVGAARASGAEVAVIDHPSEVAAAAERLLASTRDGVCAVLDVRLPDV